MTPALHDFLMDWAAKMVIWAIIMSALTCLFFVGRWSGRLAERRDWNALSDEWRANPAWLVPAQRGPQR
jgi:hypothetical protein